MTDNLFLAAIENDGGWDITVNIVNLNDESITVELVTGPFQATDESLFDVGSSAPWTLTVPPQGFQQIDQITDPAQLDFKTYYKIRVGESTFCQEISDRSFDGANCTHIPILEATGYFAKFESLS